MKTTGKSFPVSSSRFFAVVCSLAASALVGSLGAAWGGPGGPRGPYDGTFCPAGVPNLKVTAADTPDGAALIFKGSPEDLQAARSKLEAMAQRHSERLGPPENAGQPAPRNHMGMMAGRGGMGPMPPSTARVVSAPGNLQLVFEPRELGDLAALREAVRQHALQMSKGCHMGAPR